MRENFFSCASVKANIPSKFSKQWERNFYSCHFTAFNFVASLHLPTITKSLWIPFSTSEIRHNCRKPSAKCMLQNANETGKEKKSSNLIGLIPLIRVTIISYVLLIVTNSTKQLTCKLLGYLTLFSLRRMTFCQNKPW